jgi:ABC-type nitrate/sulfonate/bicarbonate transport system permease component
VRLKSLRGLVPLALILLIWQLVGSTKTAGSTTPAPSTWWTAFKQIERSGSLWTGLRLTMILYVEGLLIAIVLGVALGVALGASRRVNQAFGGLLEFLRATPAAAIVPGALLLFHASSGTKIGIVVYGSIWPILLNTAAGRKALAPLRLDVARCMQMSWWDRMRKFVLPSLLPEIMVGIRIAASICLIITLLVDVLVATGGLGYLLVQYQSTFQASSAFAMLAVIGVIGILINLAIGASERYVLRRWPAGG